ncbi:MAG: SWIM zinc finger family protein [Myxococcota bacterium]
MKLTNLTEDNIPDFVRAGCASRGDGYQRDGRIQRMRLTDDRLSAHCIGSRPDPYRLQIELRGGDIISTFCTCPVDGRCKHIAALLYEFVRDPVSPSDKMDMERQLESMSKSELVDLVLDVVHRHPTVEDVLEFQFFLRGAGESISGNSELSADATESRAVSILGRYVGPDEYGRHRGLSAEATEDLQPLRCLAEDAADTGRLQVATHVYCGLIRALRSQFYYFDPHQFVHFEMMSSLVDGLAKVFARLEDATVRELALQELWESWRHSIDHGGIDVETRIEDALVEAVTASEADELIDHLEQLLDELSQQRSGFGADWVRNHAADFAVRLEPLRPDSKPLVERCRELDHVDGLVPALLDDGDFEEAFEFAIDYVDEQSDFEDVYRAIDFAEDFADHGQVKRAAEIVESALWHVDGRVARRVRDWLVEFYVEHDHFKGALPYARATFIEQPDAAQFFQVRSIARELERWDDLRGEHLKRLREHSPTSLLAVHLENRDHSAALDVWADFHDSGQLRRPILDDLADAVADSHSDVAVDIWASRADALIADRGRGNYKRACKYFRRIHDLYDGQDRLDEWDELADWLFDQHNRLRAFKDEMRKAGLAPPDD